YEDGRNVAVEYRYAEGNADALPRLAAELVAAPVAVILAADSNSVGPAREATTTIPIVMSIHSDPVRAGFIESLRRPGGNVTGLSNLGVPLVGKRFELLREILPEAARVVVLWNASLPGVQTQWEEAQAAAPLVSLELVSLPVRGAAEMENVGAAIAAAAADALMVLPDPLMLLNRTRLAQIAAQTRLPSFHGARD